MTPSLTPVQVKLLTEAMLSRAGYAAAGNRHDDDWQLLVDLGYVKKTPKRGMSDYVDRFMATELGTLRLTDPDRLLIHEVMES